MKELITHRQAETLFLFLLIVGLIVGPLAAIIARRRGQTPWTAAVGLGGPPVLLWAMWRIYNAITDRLGLDTVRNLLVNAALFVTVGAVCGIAWALLLQRGRGDVTAVKEGVPPHDP